MAKRKAATNRASAGQSTANDVEPMVIALAEQLGSFLGRVQKKADGWLENDALRAQVSQIRDGAADLLQQVNQTAAAVRKSAAKLAPSLKGKAKAAKKSAAKTAKGRSAGSADAPAKRLRRPPPQELFDPRLGEPMG